MTPDDIRQCLVGCRFTEHARREMEGEPLGVIHTDEILQVLGSGEIIEEYPEDEPYQSCLVMGRTETGRTLHIVCAPVMGEGRLIVITTYQPDPVRWDSEYRRRRNP